MTINAAGTLALSTNFLTVSGTLTNSGLVTCSNGLTVSSGTTTLGLTNTNGLTSTFGLIVSGTTALGYTSISTGLAVTGTTSAPTAANGDSSSTIATTAFIQNSIQSGTYTSVISLNINTYTTFSVSFTNAFSVAPTAVTVTQKFGPLNSPYGLNLTVQAISTTGFTLGVYNTSTVNWLVKTLNIYFIAF